MCSDFELKKSHFWNSSMVYCLRLYGTSIGVFANTQKTIVQHISLLNYRKVSAGVIKRRRSRRRGSEDSDEENPETEGEVKEGKEEKKEGKGKGKGKKKEKMGLEDPEKLRKRGNKLNKSQRKKKNPNKKEEEYGEDIDAQVNAIFSAVR